MASIIQLRRDTAANWTAADPILAEGELGLEVDTGLTKVGDGVTEWTTLAYWGPSPAAENVSYDNTASGLTATDVQAAIDEIVAGGGGGGIPDAPSDGTLYGRKDGAWEEVPAATGDFSGPASSTNNALVRFDGTGGKTGQNSGVVVSDSDEISGYKGHRNAQTGTTYTVQASDSGKIVECTNAGAITVTLPNSLAVGFCCTIVQGGAGQVTLSAASGAILRNRQSHTKTAGQWGGATLHVRANSGGSAAEYVLIGDTAA